MQVKPDAGRQRYQSSAKCEANESFAVGILFYIHSQCYSVEFTLSTSSPRLEVGILKKLWDMITTVESSIAAWTTTLWREIQVEDMELECKRFAKEIRGLDKLVRGGMGNTRMYNIQ